MPNMRETIIDVLVTHRDVDSIYCSDYDNCKFAMRGLMGIVQQRREFAAHQADEIRKALKS